MPETEDDFTMSAEPKHFGPFTITDPKRGDKTCVLFEASEATHTAYRDASISGMTIRANEKSDQREASIKGVSAADSLLVAGCLVEVAKTEDGWKPKAVDRNGNPVPVDVGWVRGLPHRIIDRLYKKVRTLSEMDRDEETVEFLKARIESDTRKLERLEKDGPVGK